MRRFLPLSSDKDTILFQLNSGICPYCEKSGFKLIGVHLFRSHEVPIDDLKDALGVRRDTGFCSQELREFKIELASSAGLGVSEVTRGKGNRRGCKQPEVTREKMKTHYSKPGYHDAALRGLKSPESIQKMIISKKQRYAELSDSEKDKTAERMRVISFERTRKLSTEQIIEIRRLLATGERGVNIAKKFDIGTSLVSDIKNGKVYVSQ